MMIMPLITHAPVPVPCSVEMEHMIFRVEVIVLMSATLLIASAFRTRQLRLVSRIRPLVYHDSCRLALQFFLLDFRYLALRNSPYKHGVRSREIRGVSLCVTVDKRPTWSNA